jgi:hypothetical protein
MPKWCLATMQAGRNASYNKEHVYQNKENKKIRKNKMLINDNNSESS